MPPSFQSNQKPHSVEAEECLLSCCLLENSDAFARCVKANLTPSDFYVPANRVIYETLTSLHDKGLTIDLAIVAEELKASKRLDQIGGYAYLTQISGRVPTTLQVSFFINKVSEYSRRRVLLNEAQKLIHAAIETSLSLEESTRPVLESLRAFDATSLTGRSDSLLKNALLAEVDPANPPPPDKPVFYVAGKLCSTSGNLSCLVARAKTGKSAIVGAHVAASLVADGIGRSDADTLRIRSEPPSGKAVVVIDTEQSPHHAAKLIERALIRVGASIDDRPSWLRLFAFAGWAPGDLSQALPVILEKLAKEHGGLHAVFIDGGADFASNVNDPEEAARLCADWHALAIKYDCSIVIVIHSNEGAASDDIARGWLGKQLRRKCESNLTIKKCGEVSVLFSETGQRHAPILEKDGPTFSWSDELGMHVSGQSVGSSREDIRRDALRDQAEAVFRDAGVHAMKWGDLRQGIAKSEGLTASGAGKRFDAMKALGVIKKDALSLWRLA